MLNGKALGVVAEDEEGGGILGLHVAHQHAAYAGDLGPGEQLFGDRLFHTGVHHVGPPGEHQVGLAAPGHAGVAGAHPLGHRPQRDDGHDADGDAQQRQDGAAFAAE